MTKTDIILLIASIEDFIQNQKEKLKESGKWALTLKASEEDSIEGLLGFYVDTALVLENLREAIDIKLKRESGVMDDDGAGWEN